MPTDERLEVFAKETNQVVVVAPSMMQLQQEVDKYKRGTKKKEQLPNWKTIQTAC